MTWATDEIVRSLDERTSKAISMVRSARRLTDAQIAERTQVNDRVVAMLRFVSVGAVPNASHRDMVWLLTRYAYVYGLYPAPERTIRLGNRRRLIPDLLVFESSIAETPEWVVEIKTTLRMGGSIRSAVEQVKGYVDVVGGGRPVVVAYQVPAVREVDGVLIRRASEFRSMMRNRGTERRRAQAEQAA